jgi:hypothetical protein
MHQAPTDVYKGSFAFSPSSSSLFSAFLALGSSAVWEARRAVAALGRLVCLLKFAQFAPAKVLVGCGGTGVFFALEPKKHSMSPCCDAMRSQRRSRTCSPSGRYRDSTGSPKSPRTGEPIPLSTPASFRVPWASGPDVDFSQREKSRVTVPLSADPSFSSRRSVINPPVHLGPLGIQPIGIAPTWT